MDAIQDQDLSKRKRQYKPPIKEKKLPDTAMETMQDQELMKKTRNYNSTHIDKLPARKFLVLTNVCINYKTPLL